MVKSAADGWKLAPSAGAVSERLLNLIAGAGLLGILAYGFVHWLSGRDEFPADMQRSTLEIVHRGYLLAGSLDDPEQPDQAGRQAVMRLAQELGVEVRWLSVAPSDLLRDLEEDSLDVLAHVDRHLPAAESFGLTRPYRREGRSELVLAVPAGENRLLRLAEVAARGGAGNGAR